MNLKLELLQNHICDLIKTTINDSIIDPSKIADTTAISILDEIKSIVCNDDLSDFDALEEIICILENHNIYCGGRHDF